MTEKTLTHAVVKDIEVVGGGKRKFIIRSIPYPLLPTAPLPFRVTTPYYLWRPFGYPFSSYPIINNAQYAEAIKIVKGTENINIYVSPGKINEAIELLKDVSKFKTPLYPNAATYQVITGGLIDFTFLYNGGTKSETGKWSLAGMNAFLKDVKTDDPIFKFT